MFCIVLAFKYILEIKYIFYLDLGTHLVGLRSNAHLNPKYSSRPDSEQKEQTYKEKYVVMYHKFT